MALTLRLAVLFDVPSTTKVSVVRLVEQAAVLERLHLAFGPKRGVIQLAAVVDASDYASGQACAIPLVDRLDLGDFSLSVAYAITGVVAKVDNSAPERLELILGSLSHLLFEYQVRAGTQAELEATRQTAGQWLESNGYRVLLLDVGRPGWIPAHSEAGTPQPPPGGSAGCAGD